MQKNRLPKDRYIYYSLIFLISILSNFSLYAQTRASFLQNIEQLEKKGLYVDALEEITDIGKAFEEFSLKQKIQYLKERGHLQSLLYQLDSASVNLQKALDLCQKDSLNFLPEYAECLYNMSLNDLLGRTPLEEVEPQLKRAADIRASHDKDKVPETSLLQLKFLMRQGKFAEVVSSLDELLETKQSLDKRLLGNIYQEYGISLIFLRRHPEAIEKLNESISFFESYHGSKEHPDVILSYTYLGYICGITGKLFSGRKYCEQALTLQKRYYPSEHPDLGILHYYAGGVYNQLSEFDKAVASFKEAIRIDNLLHGEDMSNRKANFFMSLGAAYKGQDKFEQALIANQKAVDYFESLPQQALFVDQLYSNIGMIHLDRGDLENGLKYLDLAMKIALKKFPADHPSMVNRYNAYADLYEKKGEYSKALLYWDKAARVESQRSGKLSSRIAHFRIKQAMISRVFLQESGKAQAYNELALEALGLSDWQENENYSFSQIALESPGTLLDLCIEWGEILLEVTDSQGDNLASQEKALGLLLAGERLIDSTREHYLTQETKLALARKGRILYEQAIELAFQFYQKTQEEKYMEVAFRLSEKSKSLLLLLGLKQVQALQNSGIPSETLDREQELARQIMQNKSKLSRLNAGQKDSLTKILFALQNSKDSLIQELEQSFPNYHRIKYKSDLPKINFVQKDLLSEKEASLVYFTGPDYVYRFYLAKDHKSFDRQTLPQNFSQKIQDLRELIYAPINSQQDQDYQKMQEKFHALSFEFYQLLLGDIAIREDIQKIRIVPDGKLSLLNFDLLLKERVSSNSSANSLHFLIRNYTFSYSYSMGLWKYLQHTHTSDQSGYSLLAFQPSYPESSSSENQYTQRRAGFGPLVFAAEEIKGISEYYPAEILAGRSANEASFYKQAANFPIIHISSHAKVPETSPNAAFVALTETAHAIYDDSLMLDELYAQRLAAEMVVLSACETGIGELAEGEGIMSLGRAFTYAGARSLVMSLWEVNDASTAEIMTQFYANLSQGMSKDEALRKAKLSYLDQSSALKSQPYFWAAFIANGDMKPLPPKENNLWLWMLLIAGIIGIFWGMKRAKVL